MSEDVQSDISEQGAPAAPSPVEAPADDQGEGLTPDDLRELFRSAAGDVIREEVARAVEADRVALFRAVQSTVDKSVSQIRKELGVTREQAELLQAMARETIGEEAIQQVNERVTARREKERLQELEAAQVAQPPVDWTQVAARDWQSGMRETAANYAKRIGLDFKEVEPELLKLEVNLTPDGRGLNWTAWLPKAIQHMDKLDEAKAAKERKPVQVPAERPAATTAPANGREALLAHFRKLHPNDG